ncbi:MAG TPA: glycosyltransferase family 39 protein [Oscillatoriaceae cyanobacterium]
MPTVPDSRFLVRVLTVFAILFALASSVVYCVQQPIGLDEGYNLSVVVSLVKEGRYATERLSDVRDFNSDITTGPVVLLPSAGLAKLFGLNRIAVRIVPLLFYWAMLALISWLIWSAFGEAAACLTLVLLAGTYYVVGIGTQVMGEAGGLAFVLAGIWAAAKGAEDGRRRWWGIVAVTYLLAVLCKFQYLLALAPPCALSLAMLFGRRRNALMPAIAAATGLFGGIALWITAQVLALGWHSALARVMEMRKFSTTVAPLAHGSNLPLLGTLFPLAFFPLVGLWALWSLRNRWREPLVLQMMAFAAGWFFWFLVLDHQPYARHAYPGMIVFIGLFGALCTAAWRWVSGISGAKTRLGGCALVLLLVLATIGTRYHRLVVDSGLEDGSDSTFAAYIRQELPQDACLFGWGPLVPWGVGFMTGRRVDSFPPYAHLAVSAPRYLVVALEEDMWFRPFLEARTRPVFSVGHYHLYRFLPDPLNRPNSFNQPRECEGTISAIDVPKILHSRGHATLRVHLQNTGAATWLGTTVDGQGEVRLSYRWVQGKTEFPQAEEALRLPRDVPPSTACEIDESVVTPERSGVYRLVVELGVWRKPAFAQAARDAVQIGAQESSGTSL